MLIYAGAPGDLIGVPAERRSDPTTAYQRLARLAAPDRLSIFDTLIDLHEALAGQGWVAGDLYDGCLVVDFITVGLSVIDLDSYRRGPSVNDMGRMFGSTRFMAPEEFRLGAALDHRTTAFTLGRLVWHFGTGLTENVTDFCGTDRLASVVLRAVEPDPDARFATVAEFSEAWRSARDDAEARPTAPCQTEMNGNAL